MKIQFIFTMLVIFFLGMVSTEVFGQQSMDDQTEKVQADSTFTVDVKGVGCAMDIKTIADNVKKIDGVSACKTTKKGATTRFLVTYNARSVDEPTIHKAIEATPGCKDPDSRPYQVKR